MEKSNKIHHKREESLLLYIALHNRAQQRRSKRNEPETSEYETLSRVDLQILFYAAASPLLPKPSILPSKPASMRSFCLTFFAIGEEEEKGRFLVDGDETSRSFIVVVAVVVVIDVGGGALLLREEEGGGGGGRYCVFPNRCRPRPRAAPAPEKGANDDDEDDGWELE